MGVPPTCWVSDRTNARLCERQNEDCMDRTFGGASGDQRRGRSALRPTPTLDRKSTRLNSSHQIISYAVFCLKKKNNDISGRQPLRFLTSIVTPIYAQP